MISEIDFPADGGERLRLRFSRPLTVLVARALDEVEAVIAEAGRQARDGLWVVGLVSYEAAPAFDKALRVRVEQGSVPLAVFAVYAAPDVDDDPPAAGFTCGLWSMVTPRRQFDSNIAAIHGAIVDGACYQVNYTTRLRSAFEGEPRTLFHALRQSQPDAYCAYLDGGDWQVLSVSPELFFEWTPDRELITRPMKGTASRYADAGADVLAAQGLQISAKERAENLMIVDLLRNDMSRVAETGSVHVSGLFDVQALPTAWQMTSTIHCKTRPEAGLVDVFRALFPCGSVTGAPKVAAMSAIVDLEDAPRGAYCGAIGLIRPGGHALFNVGIRTVVIDRQAGQAECGVGSGITSDSSVADEYAEWLVKRRFLMRASASFELLETLLLEEGEYWLLAGHLERLQACAQHFGFSLALARAHDALNRLATEKSTGRWRVRLLVARNGEVRTEAVVQEASPPAVNVVLASCAIDSTCEYLQFKTTERSVYRPHEAAREGIFDTLLFNERDEITEFTRGNVVVELGGLRVTPPVSSGLLGGVMRAELLAQGKFVERIVMRSELARANGLWFINSVRGMIPARLSA